jgi:hypothetical protein
MTTRSSPRRRVPFLALLAIAAAAAATPVRGEDETEGPPAEAPSMDGAIELTDAKKTASVKLPKMWKVERNPSPPPGHLAVFRGPYTQRDAGAVVLSYDTTATRGTLALWNRLRGGVLRPDDARSGPGWWEGCSVEDTARLQRATWARCVEKDGSIYVCEVLAHKDSYERAKTIARQILDTFKVTGAAPKVAPPAGWKVKKAGEFDLWTDADDPGKADNALRILATAREVVVKSLKGKPADESRPVAKVYENGGKFNDEAKAIYGEEPKFATFDPYTRAPMVKILGAQAEAYEPEVQNQGARQAVVLYFGGSPPWWVEHGMIRYGYVGAQAGGKPQKPKDAHVQDAKRAVAAGKKRFDAWLTASTAADVPDADQGTWEVFAWHWYVRHGPGKKWRKQYDAYFDALRATGDPLAAAKAFDGVDFDAMTKDFRDWAAKWEP